MNPSDKPVPEGLLANRTFQSLLAILVICLLSVPLWFFVVAVEHDPPRAAVRDLGPIPVRTLLLERTELRPRVEVFGNLEARRRALVTAGVTSRIVAVHEDWQPGALVSEGQVLVQLDPVDFQLELRARQARLLEAQAGLRTAEVHTRRVRVAEGKARELLVVSRREHERLANLEGLGTESKSRLDRALGERLNAELALETGSLDVESASAAEASAEASVELAAAAADLARENLEDCVIRAPLAGRLVGPAPRLGISAHPGLSLGELVDPRSLVLAARVPERELLRIPLGASAVIDFPSLDADDSVRIPARVGALDAASDGLVRHGLVEIEPLGEQNGEHNGEHNGGRLAGDAGEGKQRFLPVGLFARAEIHLEPRESIWIARRHLVWDGEEAACFVARRGPEGTQRAIRVRLRLGMPHEEGFLVLEGAAEDGGLVDGDELITHPLERLFDGAEITRGASTRESSAR